MKTMHVLYVSDERFAAVSLATLTGTYAPHAADYEYIATLYADNHGEVFGRMNIVEGDELPVTLRCRSMSVGDVVVEGEAERAFLCAPVGWVEVKGGWGEAFLDAVRPVLLGVAD